MLPLRLCTLLMLCLVQAATVHAAPNVRPDAGTLSLVTRAGKPAGECPLKHTDVQADIAGYVARVSVTQEFVNKATGPVEAVYTFPLPDDAAVDDMTMTIGSRIVQGEVKRSEEARQIYEDAKQSGQAAALLDQERPNIFTQSVANLLPGEPVKITIRYVHLLKYDDGRYEWSFPMVVGPRYMGNGPHPLTPSPKNGRGGNLNPPITPEGTRAGHDISLRVTLDAGLPLGAIQSVLHKVTISRTSDTRAIITLDEAEAVPNRDFVLRYTAAGAHLQSGLLTYAPNEAGRPGGYFTLILQPPLSPPRADISPKEMVFVIDQTGSQQGWPIEKAKQTMRRCIQNLNPGDTFQLLGFNTDVYPCFPKPVPATPENVQTALAYLKPLAGAGGTDILKAADYALKIPDDPGRLRIVCFMTDGYVGDDMEILDYVQKHRGQARFFPFGIGNGVNRFLIDGMAREGRGAAEYVTLNEDGQKAAQRFYKRVADPVLLNVGIDWHALPVESVYPQHIPDVFSAGPIIVKGRYAHAGRGEVTVSGLLHGQPWSQTLHVNFPASDADGAAIATLWARDRIDDLQSRDWIGAQTNHPNPTLKQQIVQTALNYKLLTQYTSFVAVERRVVNVGGRQRTVNVPVEMPQGVSYEGIFRDENGVAGYAGGNFAMTIGGKLRYSSVRSMSVPMSSAPPALFAPIAPPAKAVPGRQAQTATAQIVPARGADIQKTGYQIDGILIADTPAARKRLAAMTPVQKRDALRNAKLDPALRKLLTGKGSERADVQIVLDTLPSNGPAKLKAAGFTLDATLTPGHLLLGTVPVSRLDALLALSFVRRVETPRYQ